MKNSLKIATVQINPKVGDLMGNMEKILAAYNQAALNGAELVVTSECSLTGYPLEDLTRNKDFLEDVGTTLNLLQTKIMDGVGLIIGSPLFDKEKNKIYNAAILMEKNTIQCAAKFELPNYGVFDEKRNFDSNDLTNVKPLTFKGFKLGVLICEDTWFNRVSNTLKENGAQILISINGSPFERDKQRIRYQVVKDRVEETGLTCVYVNQIGGQDELVFDGSSFIVNKNTNIVWQGERFKEEIKIHDFNLVSDNNFAIMGTPWVKNEDRLAEIYNALVLGTRDYFNKTGVFNGCVLGLSGGIDSALVATIAADAVGADKLLCVRLPSQFSSQHSLDDAEELANNLGAKLKTVNIQKSVDALMDDEVLIRAFNDAGKNSFDVTEENVQARVRMIKLMAFSNKLGLMLLSTSNRSEGLCGYGTLYGDVSGGWNPLKDLFKTLVFEICRWRNNNFTDICLNKKLNVIPMNIITKPPSAELRPDQKDTDSLPDYDTLDYILGQLVDLEQPKELVVTDKIPLALVEKIGRMVFNAEYKRRQSPPGVKISGKLLNKDRRYPIINGWRI
jgi:NAD+ synthase